jgi:hypothetical protein
MRVKREGGRKERVIIEKQFVEVHPSSLLEVEVKTLGSSEMLIITYKLHSILI